MKHSWLNKYSFHREEYLFKHGKFHLTNEKKLETDENNCFKLWKFIH